MPPILPSETPSTNTPMEHNWFFRLCWLQLTYSWTILSLKPLPLSLLHCTFRNGTQTTIVVCFKQTSYKIFTTTETPQSQESNLHQKLNANLHQMSRSHRTLIDQLTQVYTGHQTQRSTSIHLPSSPSPQDSSRAKPAFQGTHPHLVGSFQVPRGTQYPSLSPEQLPCQVHTMSLPVNTGSPFPEPRSKVKHHHSTTIQYARNTSEAI